MNARGHSTMILLNECDWQSNCIMNLVLWKFDHV